MIATLWNKTLFVGAQQHKLIVPFQKKGHLQLDLIIWIKL